jgi:polyferredoxin
MRAPFLLTAGVATLRIAAGYLAFVGFGLMVVWLAIWAAYVFAGTPTPTEPEAFKFVAALDLSIMTTVLISGAVLLLRRHVWGAVVGAIGAVQGSFSPAAGLTCSRSPTTCKDRWRETGPLAHRRGCTCTRGWATGGGAGSDAGQ